jgi:ribosome biogenesis GTPase
VNSNILERAGLCPEITKQVNEFDVLMRITHVHKDQFIGVNEIGEEVKLRLKGKLIKERVNIVVGDWVVVDENPMAQFSLVTKVLERKNQIDRMTGSGVTALVSNVDIGLICVSLNQNFNLRRIERYISLLKTSNVKPLLVLTKLDLSEHEIDFNELKETLDIDDVVAISVEKERNLELLKSFLPDMKSYVLLGSSGVGKSTLTNYFLGEKRQKVQEVRDGDDKGYHTTVTRSLHLFERGVIIDTPGMRGMMLTASTEEVENSYGDISEFSQRCRFSNCSHKTEPGCGVQAALDSGELESERYENYLKLLREARYFERKTNHAIYLEDKKKWKRISMGK